MQQHALSKIKPGVAWADIQQSTRRLLLEQLLQLGLVKGSVDALSEAGIDRVFMPHGLGHFLGLDVHDVSGQGCQQRATALGHRSSPMFSACHMGWGISWVLLYRM
jgi:Xaa-Pro aminopeptidase